MEQHASFTYVAGPNGTWIPAKGTTAQGAYTTLQSAAGVDIKTPLVDDNTFNNGDTSLLVGSVPYLWDHDGGDVFNRIQGSGNNADAVAVLTKGVQAQAAYSYGWNGATFDRIASQANDADAVAVLTKGVQAHAAYGYGWNGATMDRLKTASAAVQAATSGVGVQAVAQVGNWSAFHTPAANVQATCVKAAIAGVRHICTSITADMIPTNAVLIDAILLLNLRDGASGVGAIIWSTRIGFNISSLLGNNVRLSGLSIVGTAGNAMTLEISAAGGANVFQSVAMTGYDTQ